MRTATETITAQDILEGREPGPGPSAAVFHLMAVQDWGGSQEHWTDRPVHLTRAAAEAVAIDMAGADRAVWDDGTPEAWFAAEAKYSAKYGDGWHDLKSGNVCPGWDAIFIEGYYLLPVHDWSKFADDCGPDGVTPELDLLGFRVFVRQVPTLIKTGKRAGQTTGRDRFITGRLVLARGVQERVINHREKVDGPITYTERLTPSDRLKREVDGDRFSAEHEFMRDGDTSPACRCCPDCITNAARWPDCRWKPAADQANAYANDVAAVLLYSIENEDDILRKLYGQLTGHCGMCGRFIHDPESKRLGLGPDCGNRR